MLPAAVIFPPLARQILRMFGRNEARKNGSPGVAFAQPRHDRQHPIHPGRRPWPLRPEQLLHVEANMHGRGRQWHGLVDQALMIKTPLAGTV